MMGIGMGIVWLGIVSLSLIVCAMIERHHRLGRLQDRPEWNPPKALWGSDANPPPANYIVARALADAARIVRSRARVFDRSRGLSFGARIVCCLALATGLSLVPFAGTWGGAPDGSALVPVDLRFGLIAIVFVVFVLGMAQVMLGLAERNVWSRLGSVRVAGQCLGGLGLLVLVLAPLTLEAQSFRLHDIAQAQASDFIPFSWLPASIEGGVPDFLRSWGWPRWHLFSQPLTALLFILALRWILRRPDVQDATAATVATAGFGLDSSPVDLYWDRLEGRLAKILAAALFVSLFLGAGSLPFVSASAVVRLLEPFVGPLLPALLVVALQSGVFFAKMVIVLILGALLRRSSATLREDQWIGVATLRLVPLAWANLLLVSALTLLSSSVQRGV